MVTTKLKKQAKKRNHTGRLTANGATNEHVYVLFHGRKRLPMCGDCGVGDGGRGEKNKKRGEMGIYVQMVI